MDSNLILLTVAEISIYNIREYYYRFFCLQQLECAVLLTQAQLVSLEL